MKKKSIISFLLMMTLVTAVAFTACGNKNTEDNAEPDNTVTEENMEDGADEEITEDMLHSGEYFGLVVKGDSMEPRFTEGDTVIVKPTKKKSEGHVVCKVDKIIKRKDGLVVVEVTKGEDGEYYLSEINPRFGGGYPQTYAAGGNYADYLIREYFLGEEIKYKDDWKDHLLMLRYDDAVYV